MLYYFVSCKYRQYPRKSTAKYGKSTAKTYFGSRFEGKMAFFIHPFDKNSFTCLAELPQPFSSGHASNIFEDAEERTLAGEACLGVSF